LRADETRWRDVRLAGTDLYFTLHDPWTKKDYGGHLDLRDHDMEPPKFRIVHPRTGKPLPRREWPPRVAGRSFTHETLHPKTGKPWCCVEGLWEFHAHYHHQHTPWDGIRNRYEIYNIIENLAAALYGKHPMPPCGGEPA
jgi:hypothetical protein